jgi:hypothetical protein
LTKYLIDELAKSEFEDDFELSDEQKEELD